MVVFDILTKKVSTLDLPTSVPGLDGQLLVSDGAGGLKPLDDSVGDQPLFAYDPVKGYLSSPTRPMGALGYIAENGFVYLQHPTIPSLHYQDATGSTFGEIRGDTLGNNLSFLSFNNVSVASPLQVIGFLTLSIVVDPGTDVGKFMLVRDEITGEVQKRPIPTSTGGPWQDVSTDEIEVTEAARTFVSGEIYRSKTQAVTTVVGATTSIDPTTGGVQLVKVDQDTEIQLSSSNPKYLNAKFTLILLNTSGGSHEVTFSSDFQITGQRPFLGNNLNDVISMDFIGYGDGVFSKFLASYTDTTFSLPWGYDANLTVNTVLSPPAGVGQWQSGSDSMGNYINKVTILAFAAQISSFTTFGVGSVTVALEYAIADGSTTGIFTPGSGTFLGDLVISLPDSSGAARRYKGETSLDTTFEVPAGNSIYAYISGRTAASLSGILLNVFAIRRI